ncbi:hypothetical protein F5Y16DRAFT_361398 [Xylariaceae sp. FL0255]|nr:hypothetical protein F5Y16DRAFT_361398 [Xylariaceae sp. FL0255]
MARIKYHKFHGGERCEECGARQWFAQDALRYCRNGHRLEGFAQHEEDEDAFGTHGKVSRIKKEARRKVAVKLTGDDGRELYLEALQFILIQQVRWLVETQGFPDDFAELVRALWALRVRNLPLRERDRDERSRRGDESDGASTALFSSQSESSETSDVNLSDETVSTWAPDARKRWKIPKLIDTLALCYLGCLIRRLPVVTGDFYRWAQRGDMIYLAAFHEIPQNVRDRLPAEFHSALQVNDHLPVGRLQTAVQQLAISYKINFDMTLPPLNHVPPMIRLIMELALPVEVYVSAKCLGEILETDFSYPVDSKKIRTMDNPEVLLVSLLVVSVKILYSLDGVERHPTSGHDLWRTKINWTEWQRITAEEPAEEHHSLTPGEEYRITTNDVVNMTDTKLDDYMEWFERMWVGDGEPKTTERVRDMFAQKKSHVATRNDQGAEQNVGDRLTKQNRAAGQWMTTVDPVPDNEEENGKSHPRNFCPIWRSEEDLPDVAKVLYKKAAVLAAIPLPKLIRGATQVERRLEVWCIQRAKEKSKGRGKA